MIGPLAAASTLFAQNRSAATGTFSPSDVAGLQVWYKADAQTYNNNDLMPTITDSSGNGLTSSQVDSAKQATFVTNSQNGKPAMSFASVANAGYAFGTAATLNNLGNYTFFAVVKSGATGQQTLISKYTGGTGFYWVRNEVTLGGSGVAANGDAIYFPNATAVVDVFTFGPTYSFANMHWYKNGVEQSLTDASSGTPATITSAIAPFFAAFDSSYTLPFVGLIFEFGAYNSVLSSTDRGKLETYLNTKWAIF